MEHTQKAADINSLLPINLSKLNTLHWVQTAGNRSTVNPKTIEADRKSGGARGCHGYLRDFWHSVGSTEYVP